MTADITTSTQVRLQPLTYVDDRDGVVIGRPDTGSYGVFPPEGADLLRSLEAGATLEAAVRRWHEQTGETLDVADFVAIIEDLGFVVGDDEVRVELTPVRWQRLARALFSPVAWVVYAAVVGGGLAAMIVDPSLRPSYRNVFFTSYLSFIPVVLALTQFPLVLLHEGFHALAARRLNLPSTLGIGRRFYYLVAETRLNSLYSVPSAQRYLPFFAGSLVDAVGVGAFTMLSAASRYWGAPPWVSGLALALAFSGVLRILWECLFYLETDFYFVIKTVSGCTDLHGAAKSRVRGWLRALLRRPPAPASDEWSDHDLMAARWYAPLMVAGYGLSLGTLALVAVPTTVRFWTIVLHRLDGSQPRTPGTIVDTVFFVLLSLAELSLLAYVTIRDLRRRRARTSLEIERNAS
jgi:hypothetical protein